MFKTTIKTVLLMLLLCISFDGFAERTIIPFNDGWSFRPMHLVSKKEPYTSVTLPHTWNVEFIDSTNRYDRMSVSYRKTFTVSADMLSRRTFLYFEGVNSVADVFVNHHFVGQHKGGYTAFCFEISSYLQVGECDVEVWVSNAFRTDVFPISGDFNVYGGIHRPCHLIQTDSICISPLFYASSGVLIHQKYVSEALANVEIETHLSLSKCTKGYVLRTKIKDAKGVVVGSVDSDIVESEDVMNQSITIANPVLWQAKDNPYLYTVETSIVKEGKDIDKISQHMGLRTIHVDANEGFYLNGKYLNLYGFCRHEDMAGRGSALIKEDYERDMALILESGATGMRLAHYPHAEPMYDLADENGIVLWTETSICGPGGQDYAGYFNNPDLEENGLLCVKELVYQKYNHPSVCIWGICNEILVSDGSAKFLDYGTPIPYIKELNDLFHTLDSSRPTALATCVDQKYYLGASDLIAWNKYFGWYKDASGSVGKFFDKQHLQADIIPVGVSEYGGGASINQHQWPLNNDQRADSRFHPEEAQSFCHEGNWSDMRNRKYLWSKFIWQFTDIQSYQRNEGEKTGINDKGLITYDRSVKKDAFYFYRANWNQDLPTLYITSRRYVERTANRVDVKVYSNLKKATLYVNNKKVGSLTPDSIGRMVWHNVCLTLGRNVIRVEGNDGKNKLSDECVWQLLEQ